MTTKKTTKKKTAKVGRPADPYPQRYQLRCRDDQFAAWLAKVGVEKPGPELQHWIRMTLDAAARQ